MFDSFILLINALGEGFCGNALSMLIQSSVLIGVLYLLDIAIRKYVRARFRYFMWLLVLLKLVTPPSLSLPSGIGYWVDVDMPVLVKEEAPAEVKAVDSPVHLYSEQQFIVSDIPRETIASSNLPETSLVNRQRVTGRVSRPPTLKVTEQEATVFEKPVVPNVVASEIYSSRSDMQTMKEPPPTVTMTVPNKPSIQLSWQGGLFLGWIGGVWLFGVLVFRRIVYVKSLIAESRHVRGEIRGILYKCQKQLGINNNIELRITRDLSRPAICGLIRPKILLPAGVLGKLSGHKLEAVIIHELLHIKRGDLWVNLFQTLLQIFYFYHPMLWIGNGMIRRVREQAVDEMVLTELNGEVKRYSNTLLDLAELAFARPGLQLGLVGVVETKSKLKERIQIMLNRPITYSSKMSVWGLVTVFLMAAVFIPMATGNTGLFGGDDQAEQQQGRKIEEKKQEFLTQQ
ncbi:MAG: M56 family metallopeptidase, partial [Planctomycetes bacterium]|nr:M56 family metallopeptidase [Planctomycetota bacterium]